MWQNPSDDDIRRILTECRHIAVVGLSPRPERDSHRVAAYMKQQGYVIVPVRPSCPELMEAECYPSITDVPPQVPIEIVDIFRRSSHVAPHVDEAIERKVRCIWMQMGVVDALAASRAREAGITVVMDRCLMVEHRLLVKR